MCYLCLDFSSYWKFQKLQKIDEYIMIDNYRIASAQTNPFESI